MITLREMFVIYLNQFDWSTEKKIINAVELGLFLGMCLDIILWTIINF